MPFFGDMRPSKGIHEVIEIIKSNADELNFAICGQDIFGLLDYNLNKTNLYLSLRRQTDSELRYLFLKSDIVLIPYKNSSQSGVLEVASNFKKPIAVSHEMKNQIDSYKYKKTLINFDDPIGAYQAIKKLSQTI